MTDMSGLGKSPVVWISQKGPAYSMTRTLDGLESALAVLGLSSPPYYRTQAFKWYHFQ